MKAPILSAEPDLRLGEGFWIYHSSPDGAGVVRPGGSCLGSVPIATRSCVGFLAVLGIVASPASAQSRGVNPDAATPAVLAGTVVDSTRMVPLEGAEIRLLGTDYRAVSDAQGTYRLEIDEGGDYELRMSHPRSLDLGIESLPTWAIGVEGGDEYELDLAIPGWSTLSMWLCGRDPGEEGPAVLSGAVVSAGTGEGIEGVRVRVTEDAGRASLGEVWEAEAGPEGRFLFCGLPPDRPLRAVAEVAGVEAGPRDLELGGGEAELVTLVVGTTRPGLLRGAVEEGESGQPVESAQVTIHGPEGLSETLVTDEAGIFQLPDVPPGEYRIQIHHLAFRDLEEPAVVEVGGARTTTVTVRLLRDAIALDAIEVQVDANRPTFGPLVDVYDRRDRFERLGLGNFIGREVLDNPGSSRLSVVIFGRTPGVRLVPTSPFTNRLQIHRVNDCGPSYYVDGIRTRGLDGGIDRYFSPSHIEMVEVYRSIAQLPGEFADNNARRCGAIAIWTRRGR